MGLREIEKQIREYQEQIDGYEQHIQFCLREIEEYAGNDRRFKNPIREIRACLQVIAEIREKMDTLRQFRRIK